MFYDILDKKRRDIILLLKDFKRDFYLAGGTGLALQLGHRDSVDFDFFTPGDIDTAKLLVRLEGVFSGHKVLKVQEERNTLTVIVDEKIKISFFTYKYRLLSELINEPYLRIASILDIACMKLGAIVSRATSKDYIDLYFIFRQIPLQKILGALSKKLPSLEGSLALKSLVYFQDIKKEPIRFRNGHNVDFSQVKKSLIREVKSL